MTDHILPIFCDAGKWFDLPASALFFSDFIFIDFNFHR